MNDDKLVKRDSRKATIYRGSECLNCSHPLELSDKFCSYCGQMNTTKQLAMKDFFNEFIGSVFTFDSRLRYTLKDLLFKPGTITRNYVKGQRFKYANPFRFFLSVSIIYFLIQSLISTFSGGDNSFINTNANINIPSKDFIDSLKINSAKFGTNTFPYGPKITILEDTIIIDQDTILQNEKSAIEKILDDEEYEYEYISEKDLDTLGWANKLARRFVLYNGFYGKYEIKNSVVALDSLNHENTSFNRFVYSKNDALKRVKENPYGFANYMAEKIPFFLFFFTPVFAIAFWILYSRKKYTYLEHMVFIFHILSFIFLGMIICILPDMLVGTDLFTSILMILIGPFYFYKALRNFYKQSRIITLIKFVLLNIVFFISCIVSALLFFAITAATY